MSTAITCKGVFAGLAAIAMAVFSSPAAAQEVLSPGCAFVNSYSFPVVWTNQLGGSFSPTKNFNAGEVITVQMTWTGGPAATSATIHVTAAGLNFRQTVAPTGVLSSSYTLPSNSTYIDVGLDFAPANVGRGDINLTVTCKKGTVSTGAGNTDSARLGALVRNVAPMLANASAQAMTDMVTGNIDAVMSGADSPQASDGGFRVSSGGMMSYAEQKAATAGPATHALDAADRSRAAKIDPPLWNVWAAGRYSGSSGTWSNPGSSRGSNFAGGLDRRIGDRVLLGLFAGYEDFKFWNGFDVTFRGYGPSVGPYVGVRLNDILTFDALAAYTDVRYQAVAGAASGSLHADRMTLAASLTARLRFDQVLFEPKARIQYLTERQGAYVDSLGTYQVSTGFTAGRASLGSKVSYLALHAGALRITPWAGLFGDLSFGQQNRTWSPYSPHAGNGLSARTTFGLDAQAGGWNFSLAGEYGGIGAAYRTLSGRGAVRLSF